MSLADRALPRVLQVTNMYPKADLPSFGSFVASQIRSLQEAGVPLEVLFVDGNASRFNYLRGVREMRELLANGEFDLVHAHYGLTGIVARTQFRVPLVVSFCGDDLLGTPSPRGGRTLFSLASVGASHALEAACAAIIVKSEQMRQRLLLPSSRARAHVVPNGVDLRRFQRMPKEKALAILGLRPGRRYVLFPHTGFDHRKRIDLARAAMDQLRGRQRDIELLVVYHKPPEQMPAFYSASDVLLLTSDWEGSPNVVKEALACNLPVVSVPVGDVEERLRGLAACRICPRDPAALAAAIDATLGEPRPSSLRAAVAELDAPNIAKRLIEIYRGVLANA